METVRKYAGLACKIVQDVIDAIDRPVLPPASAPPAYNGPLPPPPPGRGVYLGGKRHRKNKNKKIRTQKRSRRS
jgi:hypothetical protein